MSSQGFDAVLAQKMYDLISYQVSKCDSIVRETLETYGYPLTITKQELLHNTNLPESASREERVVLYNILHALEEQKDSLLFFEEAKTVGDDGTILVMIDSIKKSIKKLVTHCRAMLRAKNEPSFESFITEQLSRLLGDSDSNKDDHVGPMFVKEPMIH